MSLTKKRGGKNKTHREDRVLNNFSLALLFCLFVRGVEASCIEEHNILPCLTKAISEYFLGAELNMRPGPKQAKTFSILIKKALNNARNLSPENKAVLVGVFKVGNQRAGTFFLNIGLLKNSCISSYCNGKEYLCLNAYARKTLKEKINTLDYDLRRICEDLAQVIKKHISSS